MHAVLVPVYLLLITPITSSWWAAGSQVVMDPHHICKKSRRLKGKMADICRNETVLLNQISKGVKLGHDECQYLFKNRRWNCTTAKRSMKKILLKDTRETAFVNALTAAGITFSVTRACSMGLLINCSCESKKSCEKKTEKVKILNNVPTPVGDWKWSGGGDNINYGLRKSKDFMDTRYKKMSDMKTLVKLHNYAAGRMAIKKHMRTECKCHGLSGSCNLRTCWKKMPTFREVGAHLYKHFESATEVIAGNDGHSFIPNGVTIKSPTREDLVYSEKYLPLQFCMPNSTVGSLGTQGRECNPKSDSENGCDQLCCGRGYTMKKVKETVNCKCQFNWCCEVKCEQCENKYVINTCL